MDFEAIRERDRGNPLCLRIFLVALLASAIFSALPLQSEPLRNLVLKIAAERTFELRDGWEADFRRMLCGVNAVFERRFGIRFHMGEIEYWAPDGKQILANLEKKDGQNQIVLVSTADGSARVLKTLERGSPDHMNFSPDGRHIVFSSSGSTGENSGNWVMENFLPPLKVVN